MDYDDLPAPEEEGLLPIGELSVDGDNPNAMNPAVFEALVDRMNRRGWVGGPIVTDTDGLIADGEHRWRAAKELGLNRVPVKQYDLTDIQRRLWRQELNKIHGKHDKERDRDEFMRIIDSADAEAADDLESLLSGRNEADLLDELMAEPTFSPGSPEESSALDKTEKVTCPECGHDFKP